MARILKLAGLLAACLAVLAGVGGWYWHTQLQRPLDFSAGEYRIVVRPGMSLAQVSAALAADGLTPNAGLINLYGRFSGQASSIKTGEFALPAGTNSYALLDLLVAGEEVQYQVTLVEGWRFAEAVAAVRAHEAVSITPASIAEIMTLFGTPDAHPEGQVLPDTYRFTRGTTDVAILLRAHEALNAALAAEWPRRSGNAAVASAYEALILASIVEKETALPAERAAIAGVFSRRLRRGMRLQADPTVIYGIGDSYDGNIRSVDLRTDTPYNTYTRGGLPPTPIALAGLDAIRAALNPEPGSALYFVATGNPDGSHYFSSTLAEHNDAVARYVERTRGR